MQNKSNINVIEKLKESKEAPVRRQERRNRNRSILGQETEKFEMRIRENYITESRGIQTNVRVVWRRR